MLSFSFIMKRFISWVERTTALSASSCSQKDCCHGVMGIKRQTEVNLSDTVYLISAFVFSSVHVCDQGWLVQPDYYCAEPLGQSLWVVGPYVMTQCCLVEQRLTGSHDWLCQRGFLGWANSGVRGEWWGHGAGLSVVLKEIIKIAQWVRRQG